MTATYNYLGYGVTDENGIAKLEKDAQYHHSLLLVLSRKTLDIKANQQKLLLVMKQLLKKM
jgi:hypothetical protein